jgi:hypothetical protein
MALPDYKVRYSPKARNLRLKVTREDGLCVVVPKGFDVGKIPPLLQQKKEWIDSAMSRVGETRRFLEPQPLIHLPESLRLAALHEEWSIVYREEATCSGIQMRAEIGQLVVIVSLGASKPATHGRFKTSHPFRVVTVVKSISLNGFGLAFLVLTFAGSDGPILQGRSFPVGCSLL